MKPSVPPRPARGTVGDAPMGVPVGLPVPAPQRGSWESLVIVGVALAVGAAGFGWSCWVRSWCVDAGTCAAPTTTGGGLGACSFATVVPLVSDLLYHNRSAGSLAALTRGVCGVGERLHLSAITAASTCMLLRPYPDALDAELMDAGGATDHEKACGAWLSSGVTVQPALMQSAEYLAFADGGERAAAVRNVEAEMHNGARLATSNLGKFRAACQRAVLGGTAAIRASGQLAYQHLVSEAAIDAAHDLNSTLAAVGVLVGHYCDGPLLFGWELKAGGYVTSVRSGVPFERYALADALHVVNAPRATQSAAEAANAHVNAHAYDSPSATRAQLLTVLRGATQRDDDANADLTPYAYTPELDGLIHLVQTDATDAVAQARAYLHGVAALCAFSLEALVETVGYTATGAARAWIDASNAHRPAAEALGALRAPPGHAPLFEVDADAATNASVVTLSQLVGEPAGDAASACLAFTRRMFPDEIDAIHHELVVSPTLYDRMEAIVAEMRAGVAGVLRHYAPIRAALVDPDAIAADVEAVRIRVPGAPRGTWAGSARALPSASFDSADGVFVMAAKQARTVFLDRQGSLVYDATSACEGPSAYGALTQNAYIFPQLRCSYYLLGMSWRPYADEAYDNASLAGRLGYIIAHEMAHTALNTPYQPYAEALLVHYPYSSTKDEAFADVLGALGVVRSGLLDSAAACLHISQSWCARVPTGYYGDRGQSHPQANTRGDSLCATLRDLGV